MEKDFWLSKWQKNDIRFHQASVHPSLVKYGDRFKPGTILVPLCGKSLDMLYFTKRGHQVIGVELSEIACRDFFKENQISHTESQTQDFIIFHSVLITIWCGDFFKLPDSEWRKVTGVYDRAALIALPENVRKQYAQEMTNKLPKDSEMLLIAYEYPQDFMQGPPFSVPEHKVASLYDSFKIEKLLSEREMRQSKDHPTLKSIELIETTYWVENS